MIVGFIGSREGLTTRQYGSLKKVIQYLDFSGFVHRGRSSDTFAHDLVRARMGGNFPIYVLPGEDRGVIVTVPMNPDYTIILQPGMDDVLTDVVRSIVSTTENDPCIDEAIEKGVPIMFIREDGSAYIKGDNRV